ncbi:pilus assembly protein PilP [Myxococcota bacterium]
MTPTRALGWAMGLGLGLCLGCGEDSQQPAAQKETTPVANPTQAKPLTAEAMPPSTPAKPEQVWSYSPVGKRDPFRSYLADMGRSKGKKEKNPEDTEMFELDQYRLTGLVTGTAQPKAMVEDPDGKGHVLRIGSRLGKNGGRITRIAVDGIVVTEEFRAPTGERIRVPIEIKLPQPEVNLKVEP